MKNSQNKPVDHISHSSRCEKNGHRNVGIEKHEKQRSSPTHPYPDSGFTVLMLAPAHSPHSIYTLSALRTFRAGAVC